jgi:septum formation protein
VDEVTEGDPRQAAAENARRKALAVGGELVLGADTDVALDGELLGKPADEHQARAFLRRLSGRTHDVVGALALAEHGELVAEALEVTPVRFRALDQPTIEWYAATGEWQGRAGGYAIQGHGAALVASIEGDYLNVVGLPLARLLDLRPELLPTGRLQ